MRRCVQCRKLLPDGSKRSRQTCSDRCRTALKRARALTNPPPPVTPARTFVGRSVTSYSLDDDDEPERGWIRLR